VNNSARDENLLRYISESITRVEQYTQNGQEAFLAGPVFQDAVVRRLETPADAAGRLSLALKARHPELPWRDISGFRNVVAHGYLELDLGRIWRTVEVYIPALKAIVDEELGRSGQA
jgi:uncharacterized protein with HEPN domain